MPRMKPDATCDCKIWGRKSQRPPTIRQLRFVLDLDICQFENKSHQVFPRRYFYPSLNTLEYVAYQECPISEDISKRILCLPLFYDLREEEQLLITKTIQRTLNN